MIYLDNMPKNSIVAINDFDGEAVSGEIRGMYGNKAFRFNGYIQLIKLILPLSSNIKNASQRDINKDKLGIEMGNNKGEIATFVVELIESDEVGIRGKITWLENKMDEFFRSELELIKMIDQVVESVRL